MFSPEALQYLAEAHSITAVASAIKDALAKSGDAVVSLPSDFKTEDLEKYQPNRRRARGEFRTPNVDDLARYVADHKETGATVFVSQTEMHAIASLNLGTPKAPGHADNLATFTPKMTAAYQTLLDVARGQAMAQGAVAEFMEDSGEFIKCENVDGALDLTKAIGAVRNITIEGLKKVQATEEQLSASRSSFESVKASSVDPLPTRITFKCVPFHGFKSRDFVLRLAIRTGDEPTIVLRMVNQEQHAEEMAQELSEMVAEKVKDVPVLIGRYTPNR